MRLFLCKRSTFQNLLTVLSSHSSVNITHEGSRVRFLLTLLRIIILPHRFLGFRSECIWQCFKLLPHLPVFHPDLLHARLLQHLTMSLNPTIEQKTHPSSQCKPINITASCVCRSSANRSIHFQQLEAHSL